MRRLLVICLLVCAVAVPAVALAAPSTLGDGTLAVRNATGDPNAPAVTLTVAGAVIGHIDAGRVVVDDLNGPLAYAPSVTGADHPARELPGGGTVYAGSDLSFRAIGGHYRIRIFGRGIDLNVVGQGVVRLQGSTTLASDGRFSLNGGAWKSLPDSGDVYVIGS